MPATESKIASNKILVLVRNREGIVFVGEANSITSFNDKGEFDVLAHHANFISMIQNKLVIHKGKGGNQEIKIEGKAVMRVAQNHTEVFLGIAAPAK